MINQYHIEVWAWIPNYEGHYEISTLGEVRSHKKLFNGRPIILSQPTNGVGYLMVNLCKDGIPIAITVHQLMGITFMNHVPCGYKVVIDHKDNIKSNNALSNLQLLSQRENSIKNTERGSSQYVGVKKVKGYDKWSAEIFASGKHIYMGRFDSELEAKSVYDNALLNYTAGIPIITHVKKRAGKYKWVYKVSRAENRWEVKIKHKNKMRHGGVFNSEEVAYSAALILKETLTNDLH